MARHTLATETGRDADKEFHATLLEATDNADVSTPVPAHGLFLDCVTYSPDLYLATE